MRSFDKTIVTCAVTGAIHVPTMSPHLPITADEIVEEAVAAADAGASIVHIHVRDEETGEPVTDIDRFETVARRISERCDAIVQPTTGGAPTMPVAERMSVVPELQPELATCNMGSINFGLYQLIEQHEPFEHEWEREYLEGTRGLIFPNSFEALEEAMEIFENNGTTPELECYDVGHLYNTKHLLDRGLLEPPIHVQFVMGIHGGIGARPEHLTHLVETARRLFGDRFSFSVAGAGRMEFPLACQSLSLGGHVRVGMEDNLYLRKGELAESNADLVEKAVDLNRELTGRPVATATDTRDFLGLKGRDSVGF